MNLNKMSPLLQLAFLYPEFISINAFREITGQDISNAEWALIIQYYGGLERLSQVIPFTYEILNEHFAYVRINKSLVTALSNEAAILYMELPRVMQYIANENTTAICAPDRIYTLQSYGVTGSGVLIAFIDSGIDYRHFDFRNEDGSTRIVSLWDQTVEGTPPDGFTTGAYFTQVQINEALQQPTREEGLRIVPSVDVLGHGTGVAGTAAGNGNASGGINRGIAPNSDMLIVKMGRLGGGEEGFRGPTNSDVMKGISFAVREAGRLNKPLSLMIGVGLNEGAHNGYNSLEIFVDQTSVVWPSNMTVGTGNEANKESHTSGQIAQGITKDIQIAIDPGQNFYYANLFKNFVDDMAITLIAPNGESTDVLTSQIRNVAYVFGNTSILINFSKQPYNAATEQVSILLEGYGTEEIDPGIWNIRIRGNTIIDGRYNIWAAVTTPVLRFVRFLEPDPFTTLTIPSTARLITSVGAINGRTLQILSVSGRGFTVDGRIKPDVVAPGLNATVPESGSEQLYTLLSGSSIAAAFMCGAYALFIEYGLRVSPQDYLYGEDLKGYVIKYARRPVQFGSYPNQAYGYGILCVESVLNALVAYYNQ